MLGGRRAEKVCGVLQVDATWRGNMPSNKQRLRSLITRSLCRHMTGIGTHVRRQESVNILSRAKLSAMQENGTGQICTSVNVHVWSQKTNVDHVPCFPFGRMSSERLVVVFTEPSMWGGGAPTFFPIIS